MAYFGTIGGEPHGPSCKACRQPIADGQPFIHVKFQRESEPVHEMSGLYHRQCSRPFESLARIVTMNPWGGF
jgi:hypothetical protein